MTAQYISIYTDGGARKNPGPAAVGVVIKSETGVPIASFGKALGTATNNTAEYEGVIVALDWVKKAQADVGISAGGVRFFLDSLLVVMQLTGKYRVKEPHLKTLLYRIREQERHLNIPISYSHIPREQNWEADALVNKTLDDQQKNGNH